MNKRLPQQSGEWIDRKKDIQFSFEGTQYNGYEGDSITSALWASGETILGRSFKYHRPRGILSLANHDVNVLVTDGLDTNIRADVTNIEQGMELTAVNTKGGVKQDKNRWLDWLSPILPVGFYYKAFHSPKLLFPFWENLIRKSAGLGIVNFDFPHITKPKTNQHCDVLIVGAGASGLSAALEAASAGLEVVIVDENIRIGGSLSYDKAAETKSDELLNTLSEQIAQKTNIKVITGAYAAGYYTDHLIPIISKQGMIKMRAQTVIVASGVFEQAPVFRNNDLPNVMLGTAAQRLVHRYSIKPFNNGIILTANAHGYRVALDLLAAGVGVRAIIDLRGNPDVSSNALLVKSLIARGVSVHTASCVLEALPNADKSGVSAVIICPFDESNSTADTSKKLTVACDGIAMSAGWAPAAALLYQAGTKMRYDYAVNQFVPEVLPKGVFAAGKVNGVFELDSRVRDGQRAGQAAIKHLGKVITNAAILPEETATKTESPSHPYPFVVHEKAKNFIDFDEDIQLKDFINAAQEGFNNIELMKRFTTVGMGPSQGKHSNMNAIRILAKIRDLPIEKVGSTTARPFFHPTPIGHLAGRNFHPQRLTSLHAWHESAQAEFVQVGAWMRPAYYKRENLSKQDCIAEEVIAVRNSVGMIDSGTLGKIEIYGSEAALFLERFYAGSFASMKVGATRYALALDDSGVMIDDGIACRLADTLFYVTASTANAAIIYREMQRYQQMWTLDIGLVNVTGAYGAMNLAGPKAQEILAKLTSTDVSETSFKFGAIRELEIANVTARVIRVGFVSELAYEIHVPAADSLAVWNAMIDTEKAYQIRPFGVETQRLLRLEMGHLITGHDTDGLTNPYEAAVEFAINMDKPFFIGQRSLQIINKKPLKKKLVPFTLTLNANTESPLDCNLVIDDGEIIGRVTSISFSPTLQKHIGLAYLPPNKTKYGQLFYIRNDKGELIAATIAGASFLPEINGVAHHGN